jgi:hypothetical protein
MVKGSCEHFGVKIVPVKDIRGKVVNLYGRSVRRKLGEGQWDLAKAEKATAVGKSRQSPA